MERPGVVLGVVLVVFLAVLGVVLVNVFYEEPVKPVVVNVSEAPPLLVSFFVESDHDSSYQVLFNDTVFKQGSLKSANLEFGGEYPLVPLEASWSLNSSLFNYSVVSLFNGGLLACFWIPSQVEAFYLQKGFDALKPVSGGLLNASTCYLMTGKQGGFRVNGFASSESSFGFVNVSFFEVPKLRVWGDGVYFEERDCVVLERDVKCRVNVTRRPTSLTGEITPVSVSLTVPEGGVVRDPTFCFGVPPNVQMVRVSGDLGDFPVPSRLRVVADYCQVLPGTYDGALTFPLMVRMNPYHQAPGRLDLFLVDHSQPGFEESLLDNSSVIIG